MSVFYKQTKPCLFGLHRKTATYTVARLPHPSRLCSTGNARSSSQLLNALEASICARGWPRPVPALSQLEVLPSFLSRRHFGSEQSTTDDAYIYNINDSLLRMKVRPGKEKLFLLFLSPKVNNACRRNR